MAKRVKLAQEGLKSVNAAKDSGLGDPAIVSHRLRSTGVTEGHTPRWPSSGGGGPDPLKEEQRQGRPANQQLKILPGNRMAPTRCLLWSAPARPFTNSHS